MVLVKATAVLVGARAVLVKARVVPVGARAVMVRARAVLVGAWPRKHFSHWLSQSQLNMHFRCRVWQAQILDVTHCR